MGEMLGTIHSLKLTEHLKIGLPSTKVVFQSSIFRCKLAVSFRERRHLPLRLFFCSKVGAHKTPPQRKVPNSASSTFRPYENRLEERSTCESHDFRVCFETHFIVWEMVVRGLKKKDEPNAIEGDSLTIGRFFGKDPVIDPKSQRYNLDG